MPGGQSEPAGAIRIAGVILAAGAGRRFGAAKQLARLGGRPVLQHCLDTLGGVSSLDPLILVLGARAEEVAAGVRLGRARTVLCGQWDEGMSRSLQAGIGAARAEGCDWALVALGDQPDLSGAALRAVLGAARRAGPGELAVRASYGGVPDHPVAISRALFHRVDELSGDEGARGILADSRVLLVERPAAERPRDVDTPDDLERLQAMGRDG